MAWKRKKADGPPLGVAAGRRCVILASFYPKKTLALNQQTTRSRLIALLKAENVHANG